MSDQGKELSVVQQKAISLRNFLQHDSIMKQFEAALPQWLSPDRFLRVIFTATMKNPKIFDCTRESILSALMQCAQLGLEPILGRAHLIPYENTVTMPGGQKQKRLELQFQPGYQGLIDLAMRTEVYSGINAHVVYENDEFDIEYGDNERLHHKPYLKGDRGAPIGAYSTWKTKDGSINFTFMPISEIYARHRDRSEGYKAANKTLEKSIKDKWDNYKSKNPWLNEDLPTMLKKSVIKSHSKFERASVDFMKAVELDNLADMGETQLGRMLDNPLNIPELPHGSFEKMATEKAGVQFYFNPDELEALGDTTFSAFISMMAANQSPDPISPEAVMERIQSQEDFDSFHNYYLKWVEGMAKKQAKAKGSKSEKAKGPENAAPDNAQGKKNPFDINWDSNRFSEPGVINFWDQNKDAFDSAADASKVGFRSKWVRIFTKDDVLTNPFPLDPVANKETSEAKDENGGKSNNVSNGVGGNNGSTNANGQKASGRKQTELFGSENGSGKLDLKVTEEWERMQQAKTFRPDLYGKAVSIYGDPRTTSDCEKIAKWVNNEADKEAD